MKDFKSYSDQQPDKKPEGANNAQAGAYNNTVELAKILSKAMNGKSEGQILNTIISEAERGKRALSPFRRVQKAQTARSYYKT